MQVDYPGTGSVRLLFPTTIVRRVFPDVGALNARLAEIVLEREPTAAGVGKSNVGGWHSPEDVFEWRYPEIDRFKQLVSEGVAEITNFTIGESLGGPRDVTMDGAAWVNLCRDGGYNKIHNHPECTWSGVYYVTVGERAADAPEGSGMIEFLDPRMGATAAGVDGADAFPKMQIDPEPGLMLVFPSWLYHYVNPFRGQGVRISIAFNVKLTFA